MDIFEDRTFKYEVGEIVGCAANNLYYNGKLVEFGVVRRVSTEYIIRLDPVGREVHRFGTDNHYYDLTPLTANGPALNFQEYWVAEAEIQKATEPEIHAVYQRKVIVGKPELFEDEEWVVFIYDSLIRTVVHQFYDSCGAGFGQTPEEAIRDAQKTITTYDWTYERP